MVITTEKSCTCDDHPDFLPNSFPIPHFAGSAPHLSSHASSFLHLSFETVRTRTSNVGQTFLSAGSRSFPASPTTVPPFAPIFKRSRWLNSSFCLLNWYDPPTARILAHPARLSIRSCRCDLLLISELILSQFLGTGVPSRPEIAQPTGQGFALVNRLAFAAAQNNPKNDAEHDENQRRDARSNF